MARSLASGSASHALGCSLRTPRTLAASTARPDPSRRWPPQPAHPLFALPGWTVQPPAARRHPPPPSSLPPSYEPWDRPWYEWRKAALAVEHEGYHAGLQQVQEAVQEGRRRLGVELGHQQGVATTEPRELTPEELEYVREHYGNRHVSAETVASRMRFADAAAAAAADAARAGGASLADRAGEQRSAAWLAIRKGRLTASSFTSALGMFREGRLQVWEEKLDLREPFRGNDATRWGTNMEPEALAAYERATGLAVQSEAFRAMGSGPAHSWLGASPDGLVDGSRLGAGASVPRSMVPAGPGVLEIKCPFNGGRPEMAQPWRVAPYYYMPQLQGLMEVFDREWAHLWCWTRSGGASLFLVRRDRRYWAYCWTVLADFWWWHVVPARMRLQEIRREHGIADGAAAADAVLELRRSGDADVEDVTRLFAPGDAHPLSGFMRDYSKALAEQAPRADVQLARR
ncbi:unnamed protein product [Pedinophyceae sp. YPF-701]|nr:unnamed protein product [Pedinophyceae sp. YPF-701]